MSKTYIWVCFRSNHRSLGVRSWRRNTLHVFLARQGGGGGGQDALYKCAYKGGGGALRRLRSGGGGWGVWILKSEFELYSVNCIAAKSPGCPKYM